MKNERRHRAGHTHEQQSGGLPVYLMALAIVGVLVISLQILLYVKGRGEVRDAQARQREQQIVQLQQELRDRDAAIQKKLDQRDAANRKATCALISTIPPDNGVVDAFRKTLKCGPYTSPSEKKEKAKAEQSNASSSSSSTQASGGSSATSTRSSSGSAAKSQTTGSKPKPTPKPKPSPAPEPAPSPAPSEDNDPLICVLRICIL